MRTCLRVLCIAVVMSAVILGAGIQTTLNTAVAAPQDPELEGIEKKLEELLWDLRKVQAHLFEQGKKALEVQNIGVALEIEKANLTLEKDIHRIEGSFLEAEGVFLPEKEEGVYEARETGDLKRILLLLKVEEEVALVKAKIAACWLESSMIDEKLSVFKKKFFMR